MIYIAMMSRTNEPVDRPFSNGGQRMCHEVFIYVGDSSGSTWVLDTPALKFL
jgi:hypothetical protein